MELIEESINRCLTDGIRIIVAEYYKKKIYIDDVKTSLAAVVGADKLYDKTVLVTGASGLVGSFIADVLIEAGSKVYVAGRNIADLKERFPEATSLEYDLTKEIVFDVDCDYIIHTAGYGHPGAFREDPVGILINSVKGTHRMLEYVRNHCKGRLLYVSSGEVYGQVDSMTSRACYPLGKQAGENLCASYHDKYGVDTVSVRLCHTFGPGMSKKDNRATAQFFRNALNGEDIVLKSKGEQRRSYLYAADSTSAILSVLTSGESGKAYDIASDDCVVTIAELAGMIAEAAGVNVIYDIPSETDRLQQSPIKEQILDGKKLGLLGWKKRYNISDGCSNILKILK